LPWPFLKSSPSPEGKGKVVPLLYLSTTPWRRIGEMEV
jgi:hypothetical protein